MPASSEDRIQRFCRQNVLLVSESHRKTTKMDTEDGKGGTESGKLGFQARHISIEVGRH